MTRTLTKTLTFGIGNPFAYDRRRDEISPLTEEQRRDVYNRMRDASKAFGAACNIESNREYARAVLSVNVKEQPEFKGSMPIMRKKVASAEWLSSDVLNCVRASVQAQFSGDHGKELMAVGSRVLATFRHDGTGPVPFRDGGLIIKRTDTVTWLCVHLMESKAAKAARLPTWFAFGINIKRRDRTMQGQLDRIVAGEWQIRNGRVQRNHRGKWIGQVVVKYEVAEPPNMDPRNVIGIDMGVAIPAVVHVRVNGEPQTWTGSVGRGRDLLNSRAVVSNEARRINRALKARNGGLVGTARDHARKRLASLRRREGRIMRTASAQLAAQIAEIARRNGCGTWQVENLSKGVKGDSWLARNWAPGMLLDKIAWQATQMGAELIRVDPAYTSQRCSACGHIDRGNRPKGKKGQAHFKCLACGHTENADGNAARNLSITGIDGIIADWRRSHQLAANAAAEEVA